MCIVSDCLRPTGFGTGSDTLYKLGSRDDDNSTMVILDDDVAMLPDHSMFAGSITTLDGMLRNLVRDAGVPLQDAVRMASLTPAEIIRADREKGSIEEGKDADFCIMDQDLKVIRTIIGGKTVYVCERD
jgi:N-acetylglucosamine-6-phosphate deacetylase